MSFIMNHTPDQPERAKRVMVQSCGAFAFEMRLDGGHLGYATYDLLAAIAMADKLNAALDEAARGENIFCVWCGTTLPVANIDDLRSHSATCAGHPAVIELNHLKRKLRTSKLLRPEPSRDGGDEVARDENEHSGMQALRFVMEHRKEGETLDPRDWWPDAKADDPNAIPNCPTCGLMMRWVAGEWQCRGAHTVHGSSGGQDPPCGICELLKAVAEGTTGVHVCERCADRYTQRSAQEPDIYGWSAKLQELQTRLDDEIQEKRDWRKQAQVNSALLAEIKSLLNHQNPE